MYCKNANNFDSFFYINSNERMNIAIESQFVIVMSFIVVVLVYMAFVMIIIGFVKVLKENDI